MASAWVNFRDSVEDALHIDNVTEDVKQNFAKWLLEIALPLAQTTANNFTSQIKAQASGETGWCKVRDLVVLPFIIEGGLWLVEKALTKTMDNTAE